MIALIEKLIAKGAAEHTLKIATLAPDGSSWHKAFKQVARDVKEQTDGRIVIKIYAGGVMGDEPAMVRKMRTGQLDGAAVTSVGLSLIDESIRVLELPMLFQSVEEVDYVADKMWPYFQAKFEKKGFKLTMLAFMIKACVTALRQFPQFNASLDKSGESLVIKKYYHLGVAVDTPEGLVVPVVRDADRKGVFDIARELAEISKIARDGKLKPGDLQGGTFSISSLGGIGGTAFTPIINAPEVAILGLSRGYQKPVWDGKQFVPRLTLPLSLSWDHRVIDGAEAARLLAAGAVGAGAVVVSGMARGIDAVAECDLAAREAPRNGLDHGERYATTEPRPPLLRHRVERVVRTSCRELLGRLSHEGRKLGLGGLGHRGDARRQGASRIEAYDETERRRSLCGSDTSLEARRIDGPCIVDEQRAHRRGRGLGPEERVHEARRDVDGDEWSDLPKYGRLTARPRLFWTGESGASWMITAGIVREDRSVLELFTADYTYVNERVARHYGIPNVTGSAFRRVKLTDENRRGLLGHGSILTLTSVADRTSPVQR